ncbi:hypothetical protein [Pseudobdellovibrio exovorus]|uniref:Secreted protein n=1 Tax=Pseudobdellovibrio exovorus JSS TaxID=1184267 RepID=M4V989_9BACT|nr:hypothetical protein [Pseudobdellovibrio exovorus]AGH95793.1 hypothetical protein A11Q_1577 [Pseudobdellovibrio exovorus JSS]
MKKFALILAMTVSAFSTSALAADFDDIQVSILSWCDGNRVMAYTESKDAAVKFDCSARSETCRAYQIVRFNEVIHVATCVAQ